MDCDKSIEPKEAAPIVYPQNYEIEQGEQILWEHDLGTGIFPRETVEEMDYYKLESNETLSRFKE